MAFKLDLSKFRKTAHDKDCTTLRHYEGHEIKVNHSKLSTAMRKQLEDLPIAKAVQKDSKSPVKPIQKLAQGGAVKRMDDGGETADDSAPPVTVNVGQPQSAAPQARPDDYDAMVSALKNTFTGDAKENQARFEQDQASLPKTPSEAVDQVNMPPEQYAKQYEGNKMKASADTAIDNAVQTPSPQRQPQGAQSDPYGVQAYGDTMMQGVQQEKSGILGEASALRQKAIADQLSLQKQQEKLQQNADLYQGHINELDTHRQDLNKAIQDQKIDPNHYMNSMSTGKHIMTSIGLLLGGYSAGVSGGPNPALQKLNDNISRDIDAQKAELNKKENLLSSNMKQYGNLRDAEAVTRIQLSDIASNALAQNAAKMADPAAKARADQAIGQLNQKVAPIMSQLAMKRTIAQTASSGQGDTGELIKQLRVMNPEMAKEMESRYVPTVGMAQIPLTAEVRNNILAKQQLSGALKELQDWSAKHSGSVDPATVNYGATKAAEIQSMYRNAINGGVFKKGEQEFIDNIIDSDPTKFFNSIRVAPKIKAVQETNDSQLNSLKRSVGLPVQASAQEIMANLSPQQQSFLKWSKANPTRPEAQAVFKKLGIQ